MTVSNKKDAVTLTSKQVDAIIKYIVDYSKYIPYKTKCTSKWQSAVSKINRSLGVV